MRTFILKLSCLVILCCTTSLIKSESFVAAPKQQKTKIVVPVIKPEVIKKQPLKMKYWAEAFFIRL